MTKPQLGGNPVLCERSNFYMIDKLSVAVHVFLMRMLTLLSVDEKLLLMYVSRSINLLLKFELSYLKHVNSVLFAFP